MKLSDYIKESGLSIAKFSELIGESPQRIGMYTKHKTIPRLDVIRKIFKATGGKVTANDFCNIKLR